MKTIAITLTLITGLYWVVETNGKTGNESIIKIYDSGNNLVNETKVDRVIDITKKKEVKRLNKMVNESSTATAPLWSKR